MYCILRTVKIKDRRKISSMVEHNLRLRTQPNIDDNLTKNNVVLVNKLEADIKVTSSLQTKLSEYYERLGVKERKDNVLMMEFVVSTSPEFFKDKSDSQVKEWAAHQVEYFKTKFGSNLQMAVLHLDESTPHIHFSISTEHESTKTYKNRYGSSTKTTWSLNAKRFNPEFLTEMQTSYAMHNSIYGLSRGKPSARKHKKLKEYYANIQKMESELDDMKMDQKKLLKFKEYYPKLKESIIDLMGMVDGCLGILSTKELTSQEKDYVDSVGESLPHKKQNSQKSQRPA